MKTELFDFQREAVQQALKHPYFALLMEQGTGKTITCLCTLGHRFLEGKVQRALVVAPKSALRVWRNQLVKHLRAKVIPLKIATLGGKIKVEEKKQILKEWKSSHHLQVVILNYDSARLMEKEIKKWKPHVIILDESQKIKNPESKRSRVFHRLGPIARYRNILTGIPIPESPLDFWSQYKFLQPKIFGKRYPKFRNRYARKTGFGGHKWKVKSYKLKELARKAHRIAYRITKEEALDLPEWVDQELYCDLEGKAERVYQQMEYEAVVTILSDIPITAPIVLTQQLRLQQITGGFLPDEEGEMMFFGSSKLDLLKELLEDLPQKKIVIFARFIAELDAIANVVRKSGRTVEIIKGKTKNADDIRADFQDKKHPQVLVCQISTGGIAVDLYAAGYVIYYSMTFSYDDYHQSRARVHRIGQESKGTYIHLLAEGTVDEDVLQAVREKRSLADLVLEKYRKQK